MKVIHFPLSLERFNVALNADCDPAEEARRELNASIGIAEDALAELIGDLAKRPALDAEQARRVGFLVTQARLVASYAILTQELQTTQTKGEI